MRLISLHIENFGKLSDFDMSFSPGKNIINEENGWGKSTLASFIKVMFFGFSGEGKRSELENERRRYKPWQKGIYGGSVIFELDGKAYRVERTFGDKKSGTDEFYLYNADTNIISNDFGENIGEEIFGIDEESFKKTVFIGQQDCETAVTPNISAKIGNISDLMADMSNYDIVQSRLKKELDFLTPKRATGELHKLKNKLSLLNESVKKKSIYEEGLEENKKLYEEGKNEIAEKFRSKETLQKSLEYLSKVKDKKAELQRYNSLKEEKQKALQRVKEQEAFFKNGIPEKEQVEEKLRLVNKIEAEKEARKKLLFEAEEEKEYERISELFEEGVPDSKRIDEAERLVRTLKRLREEQGLVSLSDRELEKYEEAEDFFAEYKPDRRELERHTAENVRKSMLISAFYSKKESSEAAKDNLKRREEEKNKAGKINYIPLILAVISLAASILVIYLLALTIILSALFFLLLLKKKTEKKEADFLYRQAKESYDLINADIEDTSRTISDIEVALRVFFEKMNLPYSGETAGGTLTEIGNKLSVIEELEERAKAYKDKNFNEEISNLIAEIRKNLPPFYAEADEADFDSALQRLRFDIKEFERLNRRKEELKISVENEALLKKELDEFIILYELDGSDPALLLRQVQERLVSMEDARAFLSEKENKLKEYEAENDVSEYKNLENTDEEEESSMEKISIEGTSVENSSMESISANLRALDTDISSLQEKAGRYKKAVEEINELLGQIENDEDEYASEKERFDKLSHKFEVMTATRDYLEKAKLKFSAKYMDPIFNAFRKYYEILSDDVLQYETDANLNLQIRENGGLHDIRLLSSGYKDLVGICRRMAFVDAMYKREEGTEAPFLIYDDPFVNLDDRRLSMAGKFLERVSSEYQILYFICSSSRGGSD